MRRIVNSAGGLFAICPKRLEQILDEQRFKEYLDEVQERGTDMMLEIIERRMQTDQEYQVALAADDVLAQVRLRSSFEMAKKRSSQAGFVSHKKPAAALRWAAAGLIQ